MNTLQYSTNYGRSWSALSNNTYVTLNKGKSILFKGNCTPLKSDSTLSGIGRFDSTGGTFSISGNIMSLLFGDNYENQTDLTGYNAAFEKLFYQCKGVANIDNLVLPATTLSPFCYNMLFFYCTGLSTVPSDLLPATTLAYYCYGYMFCNCPITTAPDLPATTLAQYCYGSMFNGCSSLNYVKAMFTTTPGSNYTGYWLSNVASTGTFVKNSAATWDVSGTSGIPDGWTVQTASS